MNEFNINETTNNLYTQLINKFFHPDSYFFICVKSYLENSYLIADELNDSISQIISQFVHFLIKSKIPAQELKEITKIKGLENIYSDLENQLIKFNIKSIEQSQLKNAIKNIALYLLRDLNQLLANNESSYNTLKTYIDLKTKLADLLNGSNSKHSNQTTSLTETEQENTNPFDVNIPVAEYPTLPEKSEEETEGLIIEKSISTNIDEYIGKDIQLFEPPGEDEDDEELLKLIQETNTPNNNTSAENLFEVEKIEEKEPLELNTVQEDQQNNEDDEHAALTNTIFHQEAVLYYKILVNAISQLKNEEKLRSSLEDMELASSSLKQLAQKFALEKIALLPELMESISIQAYNQNMNLPLSILQSIEDGVSLLKEFNQYNSDHKAKFMSILKVLREYYSKTSNKNKEISISV